MFSFDGDFKASVRFLEWGLPRLEEALRIYEPAETRRAARGTRGRQNVLSPRQGLMRRPSGCVFPVCELKADGGQLLWFTCFGCLLLKCYSKPVISEELTGESVQRKQTLPEARCSCGGLSELPQAAISWLSCLIPQSISQSTNT